MLAHSDIHRSLTRLSLDLTKAIAQREGQVKQFRQGEYEVQYQFNFSGKVGTLPVETDFPLTFGVLFFADVGNARDSELDRPLARLAMELTNAPAGVLPYSYVAGWTRDNDFNYIGALIRIGAHLPAMAILGAAPPAVDFSGVVHIGIQGYGAPLDPDTILGDGVGPSPALDQIDMGVG